MDQSPYTEHSTAQHSLAMIESTVPIEWEWG